MEGSCCNNGEFKSIVGRQRIKVANIQKSEGSIVKNSQRLDEKNPEIEGYPPRYSKTGDFNPWRTLSGMYFIILEQ